MTIEQKEARIQEIRQQLTGDEDNTSGEERAKLLDEQHKLELELQK